MDIDCHHSAFWSYLKSQPNSVQDEKLNLGGL